MIEAVFLLTGVIIFIGFFAMVFFEKTKIPDILILMFVGLALGSVLSEKELSVFNSLAPYVGAVALMMILFDGGLNLRVYKVVRELSEATTFTVTVFILSLFFIMNIMHFIFGWTLTQGLLLGAVLGGTSSAIVISTVGKISINDASRIILDLEAAISDALCIVVSLLIIEIMLFNLPTLRETANSLVGQFSIAVVIGIVVSVLWLGALKRFHGKPFGYLLTIAIIFIMYAFVEFMGGNGAISALVFGIVLGNASYLGRLVRARGKVKVDTSIKAFQREVAFFVRTFFFVYIGLIFNTEAVTKEVVGISAIVLVAIFAARVVSVKLLVFKHKSLRECEMVFYTMIPRGLAAAVLASIPFSRGIIIPSFSEIVFLIIILSNLAATVGPFIYEKKHIDEEEVKA